MKSLSPEGGILDNRNNIDQSSHAHVKATVGQDICCILEYKSEQDNNKVSACVHLLSYWEFEGLTTGDLSF